MGNLLNNFIYNPPNPNKNLFLNLPNLKKIKSPLNNDIYLSINKPPGLKITNNTKFIIFSHGNACDIYTMNSYYKYLSEQLNVCVLGYDYCGYGLSTTKPSEINCYDSLIASINYLMEIGISHSNIILIGESLGTGVTIEIASKVKWTSPIILISPYKTIIKVVLDTSIVNPIDQFTSIDKLKRVKCPIKIYHGINDTLIDIEHSRTLFNMVHNKKYKPSFIPNADHNNIRYKIDIDELKSIIYGHQ